MRTPAPLDLRVGRKPWGLREAFAAIGLAIVFFFIISGIAVGIAYALTGETEGSTIIAAGLLATVVFDGLLVGIAYLFSVRKYQLSWRALGIHGPVRTWWWVPIVAALGAIFALGLYTFAMQELGAEGLAPEQEVDDLFNTTAILPLVGVFTIIIAPVSEEIFFRGFLFPALIRRFRVLGAIVLTGALFGIVHITSIDTVGIVIPIGAIGAFFAWLYYRTGSLWVTIASHSLFNTVGFAAGVLEAGSRT